MQSSFLSFNVQTHFATVDASAGRVANHRIFVSDTLLSFFTKILRILSRIFVNVSPNSHFHGSANMFRALSYGALLMGTMPGLLFSSLVVNEKTRGSNSIIRTKMVDRHDLKARVLSLCSPFDCGVNHLRYTVWLDTPA